MSNIPPLNYFMKRKEARAATENFRLILQEAYKEYQKIWYMYIDLVKKCEDNNSRSFSKDKSEARQKGGNYECTENMYTGEQDITHSVDFMEDVLAQCPLDLYSSMEESNEGDRSEKMRKDVVPGSPIFRRSNSNSAISALRRSNSISGSSKSIIAHDNLNVNNERENSDQVHSAINASSTTNASSIFLCSTPTKSQKWSKSKKQNVKRNVQSKITMSSSSLTKKNNLVGIRKKETNKMPLQIINNATPIPKNIHQIDKNNSNKSYNIQVTLSPSSKKLKQTKLVFHKTKKTMELSNNLKSPNVSQATKTNMPIFNQDKIIKQSTLNNSSNLKEKKGTNDENTDKTYGPVEVNKNETENNFVYVHTNAQIKNEVILQEYEQINLPEIHDPLNTSNESDSTFFEENECNTRLNKNKNTSFDSDKTYASPMKNKCNNTNENFEKRHINLLGIEQNMVKISDIEEPIKKKRFFNIENQECIECKWNGKMNCSHHKSIPYKSKNIPTSPSTLLPDSPSSTT